jgi:SAM-dependent methyltransferase
LAKQSLKWRPRISLSTDKSQTKAERCPLCGAEAKRFVENRHGRYFKCASCWLVFLDPAQRPSPEAEKHRYAQHNNDPDEPGYRAFLMTLAQPCINAVQQSARCLDYGCGPTKAMSRVFAGFGISMDSYDPFFFPGEPEGLYHLIVCCEVFEHFFNPRRELDRIASLLAPGGILGLRTELWIDGIDWEDWHYMNDTTHVAFYHKNTIDHIRKTYYFSRMPGHSPEGVFLLKKQP